MVTIKANVTSQLLSVEEMRQVSGGAVDMFLRLDGIKGETKEKNHK